MTPGEIAAVLEISGDAFANLLKSLPPGAASWKPAPAEWCVNECVGHIIETERRSFAGRIQIILAAAEPHLETWDQESVSTARHDCEKQPGDLLAQFEPVRAKSLELLRSLQPEQLERAGMHPQVGRLTVNDLLHEWVHHDANHLRQAYANVQAYVWPDMGHTQRFSSPA